MDIIDFILKQDKQYLKDMEDAARLEQKYRELDLSYEQRLLIDDYIACLNTAMCRKCKIAYTVGTLSNDEPYL